MRPQTALAKLIAQLRGQLWFHHVLHTTGLTKGELDRRLDEATRPFTTLHRRRTDPHKHSAWRRWSLVDRLEELYPSCAASAALYKSDLWGWLLGELPNLDQLHERIDGELALRGYFRPTAEQAKLFRFMIPDSQLFEWSTEYALQWTLRRWGSSFADITLVAGLALEASLAGSWGVLERWKQPLEFHLEDFKSEPWLRSKSAEAEAQQLCEIIISALLKSPAAASDSVDPSILKLVYSPIVEVRGDAAWFLKWEGELQAAYGRLSFTDHFKEDRELNALLAKRVEHQAPRRKGGIYMDFHRRVVR